MTWLLDTNACVAFLRGRSRMIVERLRSTPVAEMRLSAIVVAELLLGVRGSREPAREISIVEGFISPFEIVAFGAEDAKAYASIRYDLERRGQRIGAMDMLIAATAFARGWTIVTHNVAEFSRVEGLALEDWEAP